MIVATAGHIDHGKTTLVRALTGVDTDRLPQEKARGISIDLGFAYWQPPDGGGPVGFVDVPGHERFVRNMVAGVCGIDFVLLVVAADDGLMPQTVEHLQIVDLLGVRRGLAAITKIDRVPAGRVEEVRAAVRARLAGTGLADIDVLPVSAVDGRGVPALRERLARAAAQATARRTEGQRLRYAVDCAFVVPGAGTVVTGTVFGGRVAVGDAVVLSPAGAPARVRAIRLDRAALATAEAGQRCALNLSGVEAGSIVRGDWVLDPGLHAPTQALDVRLNLLAGQTQPCRHRTPVHLHLATADVTGRVALRRGATLEPGGSAIVQLELQRPIVAHHGDRFILRDQSARRSIGGGVVVDPHPPARRRRPGREAQLAALENAAPLEALRALAPRSPQGVDIDAFARSRALTAACADELVRACGLVVIGKAPRLAHAGGAVEDVARAVDEALRRFHLQQPRAEGMELAALRRLCAPGWPADGFVALLRALAGRLALELKGSTVRSLRHGSGLLAADLALWQRAQVPLDAAGFEGLPVAELARRLGAKDLVLRDVLHQRAKRREGAFATPERFYTRRLLAALAAEVAIVAAAQPDGRFTAGQVRDRLGIGRALTVHLLECLDRWGCTQRQGAMRIALQELHALRAAHAPSPRPSAPAGASMRGAASG